MKYETCPSHFCHTLSHVRHTSVTKTSHVRHKNVTLCHMSVTKNVTVTSVTKNVTVTSVTCPSRKTLRFVLVTSVTANTTAQYPGVSTTVKPENAPNKEIKDKAKTKGG